MASTHTNSAMRPLTVRRARRAGRGTEHLSLRDALVLCGILAAILYAAMNVFVPLGFPGYSMTEHTVSELSAIGAPTRTAWLVLGLGYDVLLIAFGAGVWLAAGSSRALRIVGTLLIVDALFVVMWPPMHLRETLAAGGATLTDTLHIVWVAVSGLLVMSAMGFSAAAFGRTFRIYSIATIAALLVTGAITGTFADRVQANLPTPGVGTWERINILFMMAWIVVLSLALLRPSRARSADL